MFLEEQITAEGLKLSDVIASFHKLETNMGKPDKWEVSKVIKPDFGDGEKYLLVFLEGYEKYQDDYIRNAAVFALYWKQKGKWKRIGKEWVGEYLGGVDFIDLTKDAKPEMLVYSGSGNHARWLYVYSAKKGTLKELKFIDGYGCGPGVEMIDGQNYLIIHYVDIEGVCEACRTCRRLVYRWNGSTFKHDFDDLFDAIERHLNCVGGNSKYEECEKKYFSEMEVLYKKHPADPVILFNCAQFAKRFENKPKWEIYSKELKSFVEKDPGCKNCPPSFDGQDKKHLFSNINNLLGIDE